MTYSLDYRKKVLSVREREGLSIEEAARRFDIGTATLTRWLRHLEPKTKRECSSPKLPKEVVEAEVERYPDAYQFERAARLGVSKSGIAKALQRYGITHKKRP